MIRKFNIEQALAAAAKQGFQVVAVKPDGTLVMERRDTVPTDDWRSRSPLYRHEAA